MRMTESILRRVIRSVIRENLSDIGSAKKVYGNINLINGEGDLFEKVSKFMENNLKTVMNLETIKWKEIYNMSGNDALILQITPDWLNQSGEDANNYSELLKYEFEVHIASKNNIYLYNFISNDEFQCKSFTVRAEIREHGDYQYDWSDVELSIEPYINPSKK